MRKDKKIEKILSMVLIALLIFTTKIYAANDHYDTTIKATPTSLKEGDTVEITLGLSNIAIESGEKGIAGYTAKLTFDETIFAYVSAKGTDKWDAPLFQGGYISSHTSDGEVVKTTQAFAVITLRVKEGAKLGETSITLEDFSGATMGTTELEAASQSTKVTIVSKNGGNTGNEMNNTTNMVDQGNTTNQVNSNLVNNDNRNEAGQGSNQGKTNTSDTKPGKLPQTGDNLSIVLTVIGIGTVVAIGLYIRTRMINSKK